MAPLTELEEKLARPDGSALRDQLVLQLAETELRLRRQLAASLPRAEFAQAAALAEASKAAQEVLSQWPVGLPPGHPLGIESLLPSPRRST
jgi:hypothetical protein